MPNRTKKNTTLPIDSPGRRRLPILLRHAWYGLNQAFRRRIAHLDLTPDQFTVMRILVEAGREGLLQRDLIIQMASDPNTIASLVERMERAGLLERKTHERDRRANVLRLLPAGEGKYEAARQIAVDLQTEVLTPLTDEQREQFLEVLGLIAERSRAAADKRTTDAFLPKNGENQ